MARQVKSPWKIIIGIILVISPLGNVNRPSTGGGAWRGAGEAIGLGLSLAVGIALIRSGWPAIPDHSTISRKR